MKTTFDRASDVLQIRFTDAVVTERQELRPGLIVELDAEDHIVGFEIRQASQAIAAGNDLWGTVLKE